MSETCQPKAQNIWNAVFQLKFGGLIFICVFIYLFSACNSDFFYQKKIKIADGAWAYSDTLDFNFSIKDTLEIYNLYLDIEYADTFPTQNIYMRLYTQFPDGKRLNKIKSFDLFDMQGRPLGQVSGRKCHLHALLQENAFFNSPGEYKITLEQNTRSETIYGIFSIGLAIEQTGIKRSE